MEEDILDLLNELVTGRNAFLNSTLNRIPHTQRSSAFNRFMTNEFVYLQLTNNVLRNMNRSTDNSAVVTFTIPSNFSDPVLVRPTQEQIDAELVTVESTTATCAICQDLISFDGVKLRHCNHEFHRSCILSWFGINVRCPVCRHDIRDQVTQTPSALEQTSSQSEDQ
jgi:hypothetical protein